MEIKTNAYKAWKNGILAQYLSGEIIMDPPSPAILNIPTPVDWTTLIPNVWKTYRMLDDKKKTEFVTAYEKAIETLINGNSYQIWAVAYVLATQVTHQCRARNTSPFQIEKKIGEDFVKTVQDQRKGLTLFYPYGQGAENAYEDIMRLDTVLKRKFGVSFVSDI